MKKISNVQEIINALSKFPKDLPVYARSKYTGDVQYFEDHPIKACSISEMESKELGKHVCILY